MVTIVRDFERRSRGIAQVDGLWDIYFGIVLLVFVGSYQYVMIDSAARFHTTTYERYGHSGMTMAEYFRAERGHMARLNAIAIRQTVACGVIGVAGCLYAGFVGRVERIRQTVVYPRLGYAKAATNRSDSVRVRFVLGVLLAILMFGVVWSPEPIAFVPLSRLILVCAMLRASVGIACGAFLAFWYWRFRYVRHLVLAIIAFLLPFVLAAVNLQPPLRTFWFSIILGSGAIVAGFVAFTRVLCLPILTKD